jgi:pyroglutamyl-peptidase
MKSVLLTAFEPYDRFPANASWLTLVELTRNLPTDVKLTTRLYPVDYAKAREMIQQDLLAEPDYAIHLGQAPGSRRLRLETTSLNTCLRGTGSEVLLADGPAAYRTTLPLDRWVPTLRASGIPAEVSHHAGTFLCNALLYYSLHETKVRGLRTGSFFLHVPLDVSQVLHEATDTPCLPVEYSAAGLRLILGELAK